MNSATGVSAYSLVTAKFISDCNVFPDSGRPFCRLLADKQMTTSMVWVRGYRRVACAVIQFRFNSRVSSSVIKRYSPCDTENRKRNERLFETKPLSLSLSLCLSVSLSLSQSVRFTFASRLFLRIFYRYEVTIRNEYVTRVSFVCVCVYVYVYTHTHTYGISKLDFALRRCTWLVLACIYNYSSASWRCSAPRDV